MSDPVKNAEVEDVLSSIRRLVSEDKRPLQAPKPAPTNDRLVLTPALRVAEDVVVEPALEPLLDGAEDAIRNTLMEEETAVDHVADQVVETTDAAELAENYDDDPYNFEDTTDTDGDTLDALLLTENDTAAQSDAAESEEDAVVESTEVDNKSATLSAKIAALETAIGDISDEWEPDAAGQDAYAGSEPEAMDWEDDVNDDQDAPQAAFRRHVDVDADLAAADAQAPAEDVVQVETASDASDNDDAQVGTSGDMAGFAFAADDQLLDEDTLREMISEIVQSELQGALGERITRNVRRLVRREIHRALTARDLD